MSYTEWQTEFNKFKDVIVEYSYENYEGDDEAKGPVHSIDLHSDRELHYDYPVTELTINSLHKCYDDSIAQDWVISFVAGDIDPIIVVPESVNNKPVKWINGKPQFRSNKKYMLIFKEITGTIYIETKLLSEDKTCDQWVLCPYDYESESATYGDLTLQNLTLMELVKKLQENEMFEIIGGKTTFLAANYVHPDYEANQGNITIGNGRGVYVNSGASASNAGTILLSGAGTAVYVESKGSKILIDAGMSSKKICEGLASINSSIEKIDAILVTHEHSDHTHALGTISKKYNIIIAQSKKKL